MFDQSTAKRTGTFVPTAVSLAGIAAGVFSLLYAPSAWLALAPFVLAIWVSPAPMLTAGFVTLILMAAGALSILGRLPSGLQESFAIGTGMALSWISSLVLRAKNRHPTQSLHGLRNIVDGSLSGMMLVNDAGVVLLANTRMQKLLGARDEDIAATTYLTELLDSKSLLEFLATEKSATDFDQQSLPVKTLVNGKTRLLTLSAKRFKDGKQTFTVITATASERQTQRQQAARRKIQELHGTLNLTDQLLLQVNEDGVIGWANSRAKELLDDTLAGSDSRTRLTDVLQTNGVPGFEEAREQVTLSEHGESSALALSNRDAEVKGGNLVLKGRLRALPGSNKMVLAASDIRAEKTLQESLRRQEALHYQLMQSSPIALIILDGLSSKIIEVNSTVHEQLGYPAAQLVGKHLIECGLFSNAFEAKRIAASLKEGTEIIEGEASLATETGGTIRAEYSLRRGEAYGRPLAFLYTRDITKKHIAEVALRESEAKFSQIFSESPDGIAIIDFHTLEVLDVNNQFLETAGYKADEVRGQPVANLLANPDDLASAAKMVNNTGHANNLEIDLLDKQGKTQPSLVSISTVELEGTTALLCIAKDIRSQRETEIKLRRSEQRFRGTFENAPLGMLLADTTGRIFEANRFTADLLAYEEKLLPGMHLSRLLPAKDRSRLLEVLEQLLSGELSNSHSERRLVAQNGVEIWVNLHVVLQKTEEGSPLYFIIQMADITEMKRGQERMERLAFYDTLTDLANRRLFNDRLQQAIARTQRSRKSAALFYLDLDQFKRVNDTLGHDAGDALLKHVSLRLQKCVRKEDTVARPGGDEFTIILCDINSISDASRVAEKILSELRKPIAIAGQQLVVTTSIGITMMPQDSNDAQTLMRNADMAMYKAKERGRNNYQFFLEDMNRTAKNRLQIETELREALKREEFELFFQPKVRLTDQRYMGVECLIRWRHPTRGLLGPNEFIEIAEDTGVIVDMGSWVIEQACAAARLLRAEYTEAFQVALNISPRQFRDPNLITTIRRCLREANLPPEALEVEITETMLMQDIEAATQTVQRLHDIGTSLAIDDFGTGYSSLNYLKKFPIDTVKVDRSFVMDIPQSEDDMAITSAVIAMAHRLKMSVVAEGVETDAQRDFLVEHKCEYAQGYLFGKPMPLQEIRNALARESVQTAHHQG